MPIDTDFGPQAAPNLHQAPVVTITEPTAERTLAVTDPILILGGTASNGATIIEWNNDRGGGGIASGFSTWKELSTWKATILLQPGENWIVVKAWTAYRITSATDEIWVTFTPDR